MQELTTELCNSAEQLVIFNKKPLPEGAQVQEQLFTVLYDAYTVFVLYMVHSGGGGG